VLRIDNTFGTRGESGYSIGSIYARNFKLAYSLVSWTF
jgi:hypothetical protein